MGDEMQKAKSRMNNEDQTYRIGVLHFAFFILHSSLPPFRRAK
jgi:hypothetical protein